MKRMFVIGALVMATVACNKADALEIPAGSQVTVEKKDGVTVVGTLVEVQKDQIVLALGDGARQKVPRADVIAVRAVPVAEKAAPATKDSVATTEAPTPAASAPSTSADPVRSATAEKPGVFREVTIPAGTILKLNLNTDVGSDTSRVEAPVRATLRTPITIGAVEALPAGTTVSGHVTDVARAGKVKGRSRIGFRFTRLDPPGSAESMQIRTASYSRLGEGTKKRDAATIGGGAVGGAIVGGLIGGKDGAAKGAAIGGAGGTGVVLATRGREVRVAAGTPISVKLTAPLTLRVPLR